MRTSTLIIISLFALTACTDDVAVETNETILAAEAAWEDMTPSERQSSCDALDLLGEEVTEIAVERMVDDHELDTGVFMEWLQNQCV